MRFPQNIHPSLAWLLWENAGLKHLGLDLTDPKRFGLTSLDTAYTLDKLGILRNNTYTSWQGLDLRHIIESKDDTRFHVLAALAPGYDYLDQDILDFITCADISPAYLGNFSPNPTDNFNELFIFHDREDYDLAKAFATQMLKEAGESKNIPPLGAYVLNHMPFEIIDENITYTQLRIVFVENGIFVSIVYKTDKGALYTPFFWNQNGINTSSVWLTPKLDFGFDILLTCLWHDAKIVRQIFTERKDKGKGAAHNSRENSKPRSGRKLILPKKIYISDWKSGLDSVPERIRATFKLHQVKHSYRYVGEHFPDQAAVERAQKFRKPLPPRGYTFVSPHSRGSGVPIDNEDSTIHIIWTSRDMAEMLLNNRRSSK